MKRNPCRSKLITHSMRLAATVALAALCVVVAVTGPARGEPAATLRHYFQIDDDELQALVAGRIVSRVEMVDDRDVLIIGGIRVRSSGAHLIAGMRDIDAFTRNNMLLAVGRVSPAPSAADFASLMLEPSEVRSLEGCRPGRCEFKLAAPDIRRFQEEVEWRTPRAHAQAEAVMRGVLVRSARAYLTFGDAGLEPLNDHARPVNRAEEFLTIFRRLPYLQTFAPGMLARIRGTPFAQRGGTNEFIYWSKADLGLKPVISLTHVVICEAGASPDDVIIASRQIVANHYINASIGLTALVSAGDRSGTSYLLYMNRSRIDPFPGPFGGIARALMKPRIRSSLEKSLTLARIRLERS